MIAKFTLGFVKLNPSQTIYTTVTIEFKVIPEGVFTNPNQFGNLGMGEIVAL